MADRYQRVKTLLEKHRSLLEQITVRLLDTETIERQELMDLIKSDKLGGPAFEARRQADLKPSDRAKASGEARNEAIKSEWPNGGPPRKRPPGLPRKKRPPEKPPGRTVSRKEMDGIRLLKRTIRPGMISVFLTFGKKT
jgi:hypothetical protein